MNYELHEYDESSSLTRMIHELFTNYSQNNIYGKFMVNLWSFV